MKNNLSRSFHLYTKFLSCIAILLPVICLLHSQQPIVKQYSMYDGFIGGTVQHIFNDKHSRIWFCTTKGVSVFDSRKFSNFTTKNLLPGSDVRFGIEDSRNNIWLGTSNGLIKISETKIDTFSFRNGLPDNRIITGAEWNNQLWIGTEKGFGVFRYATGDMVNPIIDYNIRKVQSLFVDSLNRLWIGTDKGIWLLTTFEEERQIFFTSDEINVNSIYEYNNSLRILLDDGNLITIKITTESGYFLNPDESKFHTNSEFWGTNSYLNLDFGIITTDLKYVKLIQFKSSDANAKYTLPYSNIQSVYIDNTGNAWFGGENKIFLITNLNIVMTDHTDIYEHLDDITTAITTDSLLLIAGRGKNTNCIYKTEGQWERIIECPENISKFIHLPSFGWLLKTESGITGKLNTKTWKMEKISDKYLMEKKITAVAEDPGMNDLFIYSDNGLLQIDRAHSQEYFVQSKSEITDLIFFNKTFYTIGHNKIYELDRNKHMLMEVGDFGNQKIIGYVITEENKLYVLTDYFLYGMSPSGNFVFIDLPELTTGSYQSIVPMKNAVWLISTANIFRYEQGETEIFNVTPELIFDPITFSSNDNIHILYGSKEMIIKDVVENDSGKEIMLSSQLINGFHISDGEFVTLGNNSLSFSFIIPDFENSEFIQYEYRLIGSTDEKYYKTKDTRIHYSNLPVGEYVFEVRKFSVIQKFTNNSVRFAFVITNPLQKRKTIIIVLILSGIIIMVYVGSKFIKRKKYSSIKSDAPDLIINIFGNFKVKVKNTLVTQKEWKGKLTREILFYLLLKSYRKDTGVPVTEFESNFWHHGSEDSIQNRKYVAFARLKTALGSFHQKIIIKKDNLYTLNWEGLNISADICNFIELVDNGKNFGISENQNKMIKSYRKAIQIYNGGITSEFNADWIEDIRIQLHSKAREIALVLLEYYIEKKNYKYIFWISRIMLNWDYLDEQAAQAEISALISTGQHKKGKDRLHWYKSIYYDEVGEESKLKLKRI